MVKKKSEAAPPKPARASRAYKVTTENRRVVYEMARIGVTHDRIGKAVGCSPTTLKKYYSEELERAADEANTAVCNFLYEAATGGGKTKEGRGSMQASVTAAIFWTKARMKWSDQTSVKISGDDDGPPIKVETNALESFKSKIIKLAAPVGARQALPKPVEGPDSGA
jgi:hypothetical protein